MMTSTELEPGKTLDYTKFRDNIQRMVNAVDMDVGDTTPPVVPKERAFPAKESVGGDDDGGYPKGQNGGGGKGRGRGGKGKTNIPPSPELLQQRARCGDMSQN